MLIRTFQVFTGSDLVAWLSRRLALEDGQEALHLAHLLAAHGYLFPVDDHCLTVKNDGTHYRFQTPYFWPSNQWEPENTDYGNFFFYIVLFIFFFLNFKFFSCIFM